MLCRREVEEEVGEVEVPGVEEGEGEHSVEEEVDKEVEVEVVVEGVEQAGDEVVVEEGEEVACKPGLLKCHTSD